MTTAKAPASQVLRRLGADRMLPNPRRVGRVAAVRPLTLLSQPMGQNLPHGAVCPLFVIQEINDVIR